MTDFLAEEATRVQEVYARRDASVDHRRYTPFDPAHFQLHYSRQKAVLSLLKRKKVHSLKNFSILEVGCGTGSILVEYLSYGARARNLYGVDLLQDKLKIGRENSSTLNLVCANVLDLPFQDGTFDIVTQYTVFTSILEPALRFQLGKEMRRVLKPGGLIISYDFWPDNPHNADVKGLRLGELKSIFAGFSIEHQRIVLAPPIARCLAPISPLFCQILEKIPWMCSHYIAAIQDLNAKVDTEAAHGEAFVINRMGREDLRAVVSIHVRAFQGFFLSFLGPGFLAVLYKAILRHKAGIAFVAKSSNGKVVGFVTGVTEQSGFYSDILRKRWFAFSVASLHALLRKPSIAARLIRAVGYPRRTRQAAAQALLMSIAVDPSLGAQGVGRLLVRTFLEEARSRDVSTVSLLTDRDGNESVNGFYQSLGFSIARTTVTREGRWMNEYIITLRNT